MPQMFPLKWFFLFIMFTFMFTLFNSINYFNKQTKSKELMMFNKIPTPPMIWKW